MSKSSLKTLSLIGIVLLAFVMYQHFKQANPPVIEQNQSTQESFIEEGFIYVDIDGAIRNPGVYKFETETRLYRLIDQAGGFKPNADQTRINLARIISDGEHIIIPYASSEDYHHDEEQRIDINHANKEELMRLPNIGSATADAIINYREGNPFEKPEDIMNVSGIGEATFGEIEALIKV